jgi:hypothetical protein
VSYLFVEGFIVTFSNKTRLALQHKNNFYFWQKYSAQFVVDSCPFYLILLMQFNSVKDEGKIHPTTGHKCPERE